MSMDNNHSQSHSPSESATINHSDLQISKKESLELQYGNNVNKGINSYQNNQQNDENSNNQPSKLLFFNYHEYMVKNYTSLETGVSDIYDQALVITHFPSYTSSEVEQKRIVRIPRVFTEQGIIYPQFSTLLPGRESAAIKSQDLSDDEIEGFIPKGIYDGELFGVTSESPLSNYFNEDEFKSIMDRINVNLQDCYTSSHLWNILEFIFDMLTFWILSDFFKFQSKRVSFNVNS
ncbi:Ras modification protein ERF4 [Wickerhamomyces ciferrii]|uniref:Ras modification protein ERF4 n=1 Tax=Wickerhamomyces ciferrii (strain ATCC 14091 / BCRC 22168 / CBS 111 / JCM 3599 / NBRC 0793 / NRRL Y-1031 F-60-10) TaxID=1206466 RepID=K0KI90_WICCF|nr:Ras modification protein ERF4 [Wickerhamomyces ciferrii]CCH44930.1 Ras modification protein ERF4 [Wickerhamomyces ciferrii]